jgi:hypothetical protein
MSNSLLTRTFGAAAVATALAYNSNAQSVTTNLVPVVSTNTLPVSSYGFLNRVNTNVVPNVTNKVFNVYHTNATPQVSYTFQRRPFLQEGENLGHQWIDAVKVKGRPNGTLSFDVGDYHPKQEFFRTTYLTTNFVEVISTNGASNVNQ